MRPLARQSGKKRLLLPLALVMKTIEEPFEQPTLCNKVNPCQARDVCVCHGDDCFA